MFKCTSTSEFVYTVARVVILPLASSTRFPEADTHTVPDASGKVIVLSVLGSAEVKVISFVLSVAPSNLIFLILSMSTTDNISPVTVRLLETVRSPSTLAPVLSVWNFLEP